MAMCLEYAGRTQEAIAVCEEMRAWGGQFTQVADVRIARLAGNRDAAVVTFRSSLLLATASVHKELAWWTADTFARLGDFDAALSQLATAIDLGIWNSRFWSSVDPAFAPLRGDPRFAALIDRAKEMERR